MSFEKVRNQGITHRHVTEKDSGSASHLPWLTTVLPGTTSLSMIVILFYTISGTTSSNIWTDWSKIKTADAQLVGAGYVGYMPSYAVHYFLVWGPATNLRGEMAAVARAMAHADPHSPLTLYTYCMAILNAIARWR
eukprot:1697549-Rhodomonas_salina.1